jgi:hypothetical protein
VVLDQAGGKPLRELARDGFLIHEWKAVKINADEGRAF